MIDNGSEFLWRAFASTGDPMAYLDFSRNRLDKTGFEGTVNANDKSAGIGA
ncbi:MAG: hypothetical protein FWB96_02100 [Defluviitaleaceae bacterium]|nr:hypothetical protein [Defluviitaleaceae bacterium]MCL2261997.1 hypothetical protein [Defluviitaleaceae bacterium]